MDDRRGLLILAVPLLAGAGLLAVFLFRAGAGLELPPRRQADAVPAAGRPAERPVPAAAAPPPAPPVSRTPASEDKIAKATDEARVRSTYQNFRTAVATGNRALLDALRPILLRDREFALQMASQELATATSAMDREIAEKTLEALRR